MKKLRRSKARLIGLAALAAASVAVVPAVIPQNVAAADISIPIGADPEYKVEEKVITRTAHFMYKDADGSVKPIPSSEGDDLTYSFTKTLRRNSVYDKNTGELIVTTDWSDFTVEFPAWNVPEIRGYTPDVSSIPAKTVTGAAESEDVYVYYTKNESSKPETPEKPETPDTPEKPEVTQSVETKELSRKIYYVYKYNNGRSETREALTQNIELKRIVYTDSNGKKTYGAWSTVNVSKIDVPTVTGFSADKTTIPAVTITDPANKFEDVYITYTQDAAKTYTVTFTDGQGNVLKTQTVESGKAATAPAAPTRSGYTFAGWDRTFSYVTGNITVNAKWTRKAEIITEKKTVARKINYVVKTAYGYEYSMRSDTQTVEFSRTGDRNNLPAWESYTFPEINVPQLPGYTSSIKTIPAVTFTPDNAPEDVTVVYTQNAARTPRTETKTITRTINYIGRNNDGTTVLLDKEEQKTEISRTVYTDANGKTVVVRDWGVGRFESLRVKNFDGYRSETSYIPVHYAYGTDSDITENVYYNQIKSSGSGYYSGGNFWNIVTDMGRGVISYLFPWF